MGLPPGTRFGRYELIAAAGAGGMGEVYKARDSRLNRTVAIKVLPHDVQQDPERRMRFLREAEAVAALAHAHICTLYDIGHEGSADYLVMEFLEGETLASRLHRGPLPLEQALRIAVDIAGALDNAHRHAIIHRDLKPGNIMLTKGGAKLLDFGLAKLRPIVGAAVGMSLTTQDGPITGKGTMLGTINYMAPEQLEGREADTRSDIFAFGAVIYEMLTGQQAFGGSSQASVMASILDREPVPVSTLRPMTPPMIDHIVNRCLAKMPDDRWQSAADLAFALQNVGHGSGVATPAAATHSAALGTRAASIAAAGASLLAAVSLLAAAFLWTRPSTTSPAAAPVSLLLSEQLPARTTSDMVRSFAISPDGSRVVYLAEAGDGSVRLFLHDMQTRLAKPISGSEDATMPFFSPEGDKVGFFAGGQLKVASLAGGAPARVADAGAPRGATWAPDDTIIFAPDTGTGLWQVPAAGGTPRLIAQPDSAKGERSYRWPAMLPGGDAVVFTLAMSDILTFDDARLMVRSLRTGQQHEILRGGSFPSYSPGGDLLYARAGALFSVPFDIRRLVTGGSPRAVIDGIATYPDNGAAQYMVAGNGILMYIAGKTESYNRSLSWVTRDGRATPVSVPLAPYQNVHISADGNRAALDIDGANANIWLLDLGREITTRLTMEWNNNGGVWTPDDGEWYSRVSETV